jgi:hypothetical protein
MATYTPGRGIFAGRTFPSYRQYRNALARRRGFRSWTEQQRAPRKVRNTGELRRLHPVEFEARQSAFAALALMRREGLSLRAAAREAGTTSATVLRHAGSAIEQNRGQYTAKPADRLLREMSVLGEGGLVHEVEVRGSRQASLIGEHWAAVQHYLRTGDESRLAAFDGKVAAGIPLETNPDTIDHWAHLGELEINDIYALTH